MKPPKGYWQRQTYLLSSIGLFYLLILAFFAIPLLGAFVVVLIQGVIDLRYLILAAGFLLFIGLILFLANAARRLKNTLRNEGFIVNEEVRHYLTNGTPVEISFLNGLFTFKRGGGASAGHLALPHRSTALLPCATGSVPVGDALEQLGRLSDLKNRDAIDEDEYQLLKSMIITSSAKAENSLKKDTS